MEVLVGSNEIRRLLNMRGNKRLGIRNNITSEILKICKLLEGGLKLKFLESKYKETDNGSWVDYYILLEALKLEENNIEYLGSIFTIIGEFIKKFRLFSEIDYTGIQEVECGLPKFYYFLIYIHSDGKDK